MNTEFIAVLTTMRFIKFN